MDSIMPIDESARSAQFTQLSPTHPGITELFALLACGEVTAFYRLSAEAEMAPDLQGKISMALMAAAEMDHYAMLYRALESRSLDPVSAISRYWDALERYHQLTLPRTWLEALVKIYVGDAMAADFYLAISQGLPTEEAQVIQAALAETGHSQFVVETVRQAVRSSDQDRNRLALWSRRLLGEAITQAQYVLADHDELVDLVMSSAGLTHLGSFFDGMRQTHDERMSELGLI